MSARASGDSANVAMKKQAIVADSRRPAQPRHAPRLPGPLEGATFRTGAASAATLPVAGPREIAFAGRSNAGKSSAINALARRSRLAYASRTPGRTQQINFFDLRGGGVVTDLPGYGYAAVPRTLKEGWQDFLWRYITTRDTLIGLVLIVDARHGLRPLDRDLVGEFLPSGRPLLVLATKADKLSAAARRAAVAAIAEQLREAFGAAAQDVRLIAFSATSGQGVPEADAVLSGWLS